MTDEEDTCRSVDIGGQVIRVRGATELTDLDKQRLGEVLEAARRKFEHEDALERLTRAGEIGRPDCNVRRQD